MACTTLLVGKNASYDGSTMIARNDDSGSGHFTAKKFVVVQPEEHPAVYRSVLSHVEIPLPGDPMRMTAMPNAVEGKGIWAAAGVNAANVGMTATETITSNPRVLGADPLVVYQPARGEQPEVPGGIGEEDIVYLVLPYIHTAREFVDIPVFGGFEPATHFALGLADNISIVTVMPNVVSLMEGNVSKARLNDRIVSVRNVNIPVEELQDHEKLCRALVEQSLLAIREDGAQAIVMGCTGFVDVAERIKHDLLAEGYDVPVLEAAQSALKLCEVYAKMGLRQSRLTYMTPPKRK